MKRIVELICRHVLIPFKRRVSHASFSRVSTDSLVVSCRLSDGTIGWGESLPREYVTGESVDSALAQLQQTDLSPLFDRPIADPADLIALSESLAFDSNSDSTGETSGNALRCAIELSILDAGCRALGLPLSELTRYVPEASGLYVQKDRVQYSGAITTSKPVKAAAYSWFFRLRGFHQCKVKVGVPGIDDVRLLQNIRRQVGSRMQLRLDANEAWSCEEAAGKIAALEPFDIVSVEQPVPHRDVACLKSVRTQIKTPLMLDESLCTLADARRAIDGGWCDLFNIRISKCGGYVKSLQLAALARQSGLGFQLGAQVGETGILSAAGRHFACSVDGLVAVEGSFDGWLVRERLTRQNLTFGWGGWGQRLTGPGLGIEIDPAALARVTQRELTIPAVDGLDARSMIPPADGPP